jgi:tetratricopeptide (TPR) repeat protein
MLYKQRYHRFKPDVGRLVLLTFFLAFFWILGSSKYVCAFSWDLQPPIPTYDSPRWEKVRVLWNKHYNEGDDLNDLIDTLKSLKEEYPAKIEPVLLLAQAHYLHARYKKNDRKEHFEKAEQYALQACKMDPKNLYAFFTLVETLCYNRDREYIFSKYGTLIKSYTPIKGTGEALPDMKYPGWNAFKALWLARVDVEKGKAAAAMVEKIARENPADGLAQIWAARANYYVGEYYTGIDEHEKGIPYYKQGIAYAAIARKLLPNSVPANYYYMLNRSRSIQFTNIANKARYLNDILNPLLFCSKENSAYYFYGPIISLATIVTSGGWITEKGMRLTNITVDMDMNFLELAEIMFPDYYYIPFARADILAYKGKKAEALAVLEKLIIRDPNVEPLVPCNHGFLREAKRLYNKIKQGKY